MMCSQVVPRDDIGNEPVVVAGFEPNILNLFEGGPDMLPIESPPPLLLCSPHET